MIIKVREILNVERATLSNNNAIGLLKISAIVTKDHLIEIMNACWEHLGDDFLEFYNIKLNHPQTNRTRLSEKLTYTIYFYVSWLDNIKAVVRCVDCIDLSLNTYLNTSELLYLTNELWQMLGYDFNDHVRKNLE